MTKNRDYMKVTIFVSPKKIIVYVIFYIKKINTLQTFKRNKYEGTCMNRIQYGITAIII